MQPRHLAEFVRLRAVLLLHGLQLGVPAFAACLGISRSGSEFHHSPHRHP